MVVSKISSLSFHSSCTRFLTHLSVHPAREEAAPPQQQASTITRSAPTNLDPYNISNDHHYEGGKQRVRQTFGTIIVQHAWPALKLQLPFVRTYTLQLPWSYTKNLTLSISLTFSFVPILL